MNYVKIAKEFSIGVHQHINHMYDEYLPYEFHLRMTVKALKDFPAVIAAMCEAYPILTPEKLEAAQWNHDDIEDVPTLVNYNTLVQLYNPKARNLKDPTLDRVIPEIVRAVSNDMRGRTRAERMCAAVYNDIVNVAGATPVKLADRIGNTQYSKMTGSSMFKKYKSEHEEFIHKLQGPQIEICKPMQIELEKIISGK